MVTTHLTLYGNSRLSKAHLRESIARVISHFPGQFGHIFEPLLPLTLLCTLVKFCTGRVLRYMNEDIPLKK